MRIAGRCAVVFIFVSLSCGSFADEAAQVTFALRLANSTSSVSALLAAGLVGGILAGPLSPIILQRVGPYRTIPSVFVVQSVLIAAASLTNQFWNYIAVSTALGCTGSILWSAVMVAIPTYTNDERRIDRINRVTQSVRNLGYVGGPALGGTLYGIADNAPGLLLLAFLVLLPVPLIAACFRLLGISGRDVEQTSAEKKRRVRLDVRGLLGTTGVIRATSPLLMTVMLTSVLNVLLIFRVRTELELSAQTYGLVISMLSIGLIFGPIGLSGMFARFGDAAGASLAAGIIGVGIVWVALSDVAWAIMCATFLIGAANGVQNALMGSFMMKAIDPKHRSGRMPAYVLCIQISVFIGFIGAGLVSTSHVVNALISVGIATAIIGGCGFLLNPKNRANIVPRGVR